jgi:hypothetical protein
MGNAEIWVFWGRKASESQPTEDGMQMTDCIGKKQVAVLSNE